MSHCVSIPGGVLCISDTEVECPHCKVTFDATMYEKRLEKSKRGHLRVHCPHCRRKVGLAVDMTGDLVGFDLNPPKKLVQLKKLNNGKD